MSTVKHISPVLAEIDITIPKESVEESANQMLGRISKDAKISGFRKGKVPRAVLRRLFGKAVYAELRAELLTRYFIESLEEHDLKPIAEPNFDADEVVEGQDYHFSVKVETAPRIEKLITDDVSVEKHRIVLDSAVVDKELERLRATMAQEKELETPRAIQKGDAVTLELKREEDGVWQEEPLPPQNIILEDNISPPPLLEALIGANLGDEKEVVLGPDSGQMKFLCKVMVHKERVLPKLDDEFAKDMGDFETLAELRADIENNYRRSLERQEENRLKHALFDAVREKNPMDLPPTILAKQTEMMKAQFSEMMGRIAASSKDLEDEDMSNSPEKLDESSSNAARDIVHQHFLIEEIARMENLTVTDDDLEAEFSKMADETGLPLPRIKAQYSKDGRMTDMKTSLLERKVFDFLVPKVKITEIDPPTSDAGGDAND